MCGIVGAFGIPQAPRHVLEGLQRVQYRGYDSAGIAWLEPQGIEVRKVVGSPDHLPAPDIDVQVAIGHTRWATHGVVCPENAHPHLDSTGRYAIVHNGTIEDHEELRRELTAAGHTFTSQTDSEVLAHLYERARRSMAAPEALRDTISRLEGSWAFLALDADAQQVAFAAHRTPLVVGLLPHAVVIASDVSAIVGHTRHVIFLEDGDHGVLDAQGLHLFDATGQPRAPEPTLVDWDVRQAERGGHAHFMLKEIHEAPQALNQCLGGRIRHDPLTLDAGFPLAAWGRAQRVRLVGCGTSHHAAILGAWFLETWAGIPAQAVVASDLRDRPAVEEPGTLYVGISQSGETLDTIEALRGQVQLGHPVLGITNVQGSSLQRLAGTACHTRVGPEVGVAATKTFVGQVAVLATWAIQWGLQNGHLQHHEAAVLADQLDRMPRTVEAVLAREAAFRRLGQRLARHKDIFFVGRGAQQATALEAALKFKEITYLHAEGFGAGELKHGPFALLDKHTPCVVFLPSGPARLRTLNTVQEIAARGAPVHVVAQGDPADVEGVAAQVIPVPETHPLLSSLPFAVAGQLIAYHAAAKLGREIDRPRNLAKSVTVE